VQANLGALEIHDAENIRAGGEIEGIPKSGGELKVETTICHEIRQSQKALVIDHVAEYEMFCGHHTSAM
jgi:hypothetical protein